MNCEIVEGIELFLEKVYDKNIPCFVNSGGNEIEVKSILKNKNLNKYFTKILGSPKSKIENMDKIQAKLGNFDKCYFFGDSKHDFEISKLYNCHFIFVSKYSEWINCPKKIQKNSIKTFIDIL